MCSKRFYKYLLQTIVSEIYFDTGSQTHTRAPRQILAAEGPRAQREALAKAVWIPNISFNVILGGPLHAWGLTAGDVSPGCNNYIRIGRRSLGLTQGNLGLKKTINLEMVRYIQGVPTLSQRRTGAHGSNDADIGTQV